MRGRGLREAQESRAEIKGKRHEKETRSWIGNSQAKDTRHRLRCKGRTAKESQIDAKVRIYLDIDNKIESSLSSTSANQ